jgi:hypothetical protein
MSASTTIAPRHTHTDGFAALRTQVRGRVATPTDADWDRVRAAWNLHVDQHPAAVVQAADADDVVATVRFARSDGYSVAAQPSGHGATGSADGTILLRTRQLGGIEVDTDARVARVGAGVKVREVQAALVGTGLSLLAGSNGDPSVVGYTLGGGLSWFGRRYGLAANHVRALDVVRPDGEPARVTAESDPDLFWALRGGGGDYAIVTAMEIGLVEAPHIYGGRLMWPQERAGEVLRTFAGLARTAPEELSLWAWLLNFPPVEQIPEPMRGQSFVAVDFTFLGSTEAAEDLVAPLRALETPVLDTTGTVPVDQIGTVAMEPDDPTPAVEGSTLLHTFDEHTIWSLLAVTGPETRSPLLGVEIRHLGGALARPAEEPGVQSVVDGEFLVFYLGIPMVPGIEPQIHERMALLDTALGPFSTGRRFFNFTPGADPSSAIGGEQLARLREIKRRRDPLGVIRSNRPVLPSVVEEGLASIG